MKKAAIFDMDGTMFDTERIWKENWDRIIEDFGYEAHPEFHANACGTSAEGIKEVIRQFYPGIDEVAYHTAVSNAVSEVIEREVPVKEGLYELVDYLRAQGVKLAIASSSKLEKIRHCLKMTDLEDKFDILLSGYDLENGKPAPDIFFKAAEALEEDPSDCYVFEDGLNGVYAGLASGAETVMIIDLTEPDDRAKEGCAGIYNSLYEVMDAIKAGEI